MDKMHDPPDAFEHFAEIEAAFPCEKWLRCYDVEREVIWINTAVEKENNVVKLEPKRW